MRIWDVSPEKLCRNHLLGEHRELHAIWIILTENNEGYLKYPETLRWAGKLKALHIRHGKLVKKMGKRGCYHKSVLPSRLATGSARQLRYVDPVKEQIRILENKRCECGF